MIDEAMRQDWTNLTPCRACAEVRAHSVSDGEADFCVDCVVDHWMMRRITLAPDRYCGHCDMIRSAQEGFGDRRIVWRERPTCLACGQAAYFPAFAPGHVAALCLHCEAAQTFEGEVFCPACGTIEDVVLGQLLATLEDEWDELTDPGDETGEPIDSWEDYIASVQAMQECFEQGPSRATVTQALAEVSRQLAYLSRCEDLEALIRQELLRNRERETPLLFCSPGELRRLRRSLRAEEGSLEDRGGPELWPT